MSDDAITKERIEAIGFRSSTFGFHILGELFVDATIPGCPVYIGDVYGRAKPLDAITTMTKLNNLIKALRGET